MARMRADLADYSSSRWEIDQPAYRVYLWDRTPEGAWRSEEWRISEADVEAVTAWIEHNAQGRYVTWWVEIVVAGEVGLVRLGGWEPPRPDTAPDWVTTAPPRQ